MGYLVIYEGREYTDTKGKLNALNEHFASVGSKKARSVPDTDTHFSEYLTNPIQNSFFCTPATPPEIVNTINSLKNKSCSPDSIPNKLYKAIAPYISEPLSYLFNLS